MKRRVLRALALALMVAGGLTLARMLVAGPNQPAFVLSVACGLVLAGFVVLVIGSRVRAYK
jgi:hypothetical protein